MVCIYTCIWKTQSNPKCLPEIYSTLLFEAVSQQLGAHQFCIVPAWPESYSNLLFLPSQNWGYSHLFNMISGIKPRSYACRVSDLLTKPSPHPQDNSLQKWDHCSCTGSQDTAEKGADICEQHCSSVCGASETIACPGHLHTCFMSDETRSCSYVADSLFLCCCFPRLARKSNKETHGDIRVEWRW